MLAETYLGDHKIENGGKISPFKQSCINRLLKLFSGKILRDVTPGLIEEYRRWRLKDVSKGTINHEVGVLRHMLNKAILLGWLDKNPVSQVKQFKVKSARFRYLNAEEKERLLNACSPMLRDMAVVSMQTGLVGKDLLGLHRGNIDFGRKLIIMERCKTGNPVEVPITKEVTTIIERLSFGAGDNGLLFRKPDGTGYKGNRSAWRSAIALAGLKNFRPYDLRHTFATDLVSAGVDIFTVSKFLGHGTVRTSMIYAHLAPEHRDQELQKFEQYLEGGGVSIRTKETG